MCWHVTGKGTYETQALVAGGNVVELMFEAIAKIADNMAIGISYHINAVFKVNMVTGESDYIGVVPGEKINQARLYTKAVFCNGKVYFVPSAADSIAVFDVERETISTIKVIEPKRVSNYKVKSKFNGAVVHNNYLFFIPCTYPGVIRLNMNDGSVEYFDSWVADEKYVFRKHACVDGVYFYVTSTINNLVFRFDMSSGEGKFYNVGQHNAGTWSLCKVGSCFWLAPQSPGPIVKWNPVTGETTEISQYPEGFVGHDFLFTRIFSSGSDLILIPAYANMGVSIDTLTHTMRKSSIKWLNNNDVVRYMFEVVDAIYLHINRRNEEINIKIDKCTLEATEYKFFFNKGYDDYITEYGRNVLSAKECVKENSFWGLRNYINVLTEEICK